MIRTKFGKDIEVYTYNVSQSIYEDIWYTVILSCGKPKKCPNYFKSRSLAEAGETHLRTCNKHMMESLEL